MDIQNKTLNVHFIGVGGVSMSSLARYLHGIGFCVSGSDIAESKNLDKLREEGIMVYIGHSSENVAGKDVVIYSDAISEANPELMEAKANKLYILRRGELLKIVSENFKKKIGVCGCHGKTTATCMLAHVFDEANERFTAHIGGFDLKFGNFVSKGNKYFISEVCEYKKNLDNFDADFAVCLNAEADHLDCYKNREELRDTYFGFLKRAYKAIICHDDKTLSGYNGDNIVTFGLNPESDFRAANITEKEGRYSFDLYVFGVKSDSVKLKVFGGHNVLNSLAVFACAYLCGIDLKTIRRGLENFRGVERRFENIGSINGAEVIADYAHHPTEIAEAVKTINEAKSGRVFVVFQPHTFSRTIFLKEQFVKVLSDVQNLSVYKTYPAREKYIEGGSAEELAKLLPSATYYDRAEQLLAYLYSVAKKGDTVLVLGAGDLEGIIRKSVGKC